MTKYKELKEKYDKILILLGDKKLKVSAYKIENEIRKHLKDVRLLEEFCVDSINFPECIKYYIWTDRHKATNCQKQPDINDEIINVSFPTGAYIFGDYYPKKLFDDFYNELKDKLKPEFVDDINRSFYLKITDCKNIVEKYNIVLDKYKELNIEEHKKYKIKKLEKELKELS